MTQCLVTCCTPFVLTQHPQALLKLESLPTVDPCAKQVVVKCRRNCEDDSCHLLFGILSIHALTEPIPL